MKLTARLFLTLSLAFLFWRATPARADMLFIFSESGNGGVNVVGSGSGLVDRPDGISSSDWDIQDFMTNFLSDTFTDAQTSADFVNGSFANVTTGQTESLLNFDVDRDGGPSDDNDLDFDTANVLSFSFEDEFRFQMTATFEPTTLPFSELIVGTHIDVGRTMGAGIAEESFGVTTVRVVPEPAAAALFMSCLCGLALVQRYRN